MFPMHGGFMGRKKGGGDGPPLNTDMLFWWDFADTSTIDLTGTSIDEVRSKDPFSVALKGGWELTPFTNAPTYDSINQCAVFDRALNQDLVSDFLTETAGNDSTNGFYSIVCEFNSATAALFANVAASAGLNLRVAGNGANSTLFSYGGRLSNAANLETVITPSLTITLGTKYLITGISDADGRYLRINGVQEATDLSGNKFPARLTPLSVPRRSFLGGFLNATSVIQRRSGKCYEWIAYQLYDEATMLTVESYLINKWGL